MKIDYIEFRSGGLEETQRFFADAFGWSFVDYGDDYRAIEGAGLDGGIDRMPRHQETFVILKTDDLETALSKVSAAGATITRAPYDFPGGRRFEFTEPGGAAMAVWAEPA